jgi:hypothetical protein
MSNYLAEWYVAKFIPDLRRNEPINVGVLLVTPTGRRSRFRGQRADGTIDGHRARFAGSVENWRRWVGYWNWRLHEGEDPAAMIDERPHSNFIIAHGGRQIAGEPPDPDKMIDELYETLVSDSHSDEQVLLSGFAQEVDDLVQRSRLESDPAFRRGYEVTLRERGPYTFPFAWHNGHTTVGYQVGTLRSDVLDAAGFRLALLPPSVGAVVFTPQPLSAENPAQRALLEVAHEAPVGSVTPDDVYQMFATAPSDHPQLRLTKR